jgi:hypothetical protein
MSDEKEVLNWGDVIHVSESAPHIYRPGELGWIVGKGHVDNQALADELNIAVGTVIRTVEFENGDAIDIPIQFLEPYGRCLAMRQSG